MPIAQSAAEPKPIAKAAAEPKVTIYARQKDEAAGWRYRRVNTGPGRRPAKAGAFYIRYTLPNGKQPFKPVGDNLDEAIAAAEKTQAALQAAAKGLTVTELEELGNANRVPIKTAVEKFLEQKRGKSKKTLAAYTNDLHQFIEALGGRVRFLDEITIDALRRYKNFMMSEGYAGKTIDNRLTNIETFLKANKIEARLPRGERPVIEEEVAVPYTEEDLKRLFAQMDEEEKIRYKFFLATACRDKEVTFAAWNDIDFTKSTYQVRRKEDVGFTPKSHESRTVPLPASLVAMLKERRKNPAHPRWIFVNEDGRPDNHFLRKLKRIALRAGLNCGQCRTTITKGKYDRKHEVEVTCKTDPVCEHIYLHRLRKTCATRWQEHGIPIRTIQAWLGHKNLETTMIYLGVTDTEKLRGQIDKAFGD